MNYSKEKSFLYVIFLAIFLLIILLIIYIKYIPKQNSYALNYEEEVYNEIKISSANFIDLSKIIAENTKQLLNKEEIYERQEELEYITKYRNNDQIYKGQTIVSQEGRSGIQTITMKKIFDNNGKLIKEEQVGCRVTKASLDKIIDIGTKIYVEPKKEIYENNNLSFDIPLNKPSGFSMEQFKKILTDNKDVNKIFETNSDYFYYIEDEYKINGIFVAAIGIHESAWGTSNIAKNKYNLFGYGAYDTNPYNGAYSFTNYSESIDLIARVLVKYYLNPPGATIYDENKASGKYYNGNTISAVNKKYATDKNWKNAVYKYMDYLYGKI